MPPLHTSTHPHAQASQASSAAQALANRRPSAPKGRDASPDGASAFSSQLASQLQGAAADEPAGEGAPAKAKAKGPTRAAQHPDAATSDAGNTAVPPTPQAPAPAPTGDAQQGQARAQADAAQAGQAAQAATGDSPAGDDTARAGRAADGDPMAGALQRLGQGLPRGLEAWRQRASAVAGDAGQAAQASGVAAGLAGLALGPGAAAAAGALAGLSGALAGEAGEGGHDAAAGTTTPGDDAGFAAALAATGLAGASGNVGAHGLQPELPAAPVAHASLPMPPQSPAFTPALGEQLAVWVRDGIQQAEIALHPRDLGPIRVRIDMDQGVAQVQLHADVASTRDALQQALPALAEALGQAGVQLGGSNVSDQSASSQGDPGARPAAAGRGATGTGTGLGGEGTGSGGAAAPALRRVRGLLDTYA